MEQLEPGPLLYPECLLPKWKEHLLRPVWVRMYPGLFCAEDLQHTKQERYGYGFGDWFTSIHLHFRFQDCTVLGRGYFREKDYMFPRALEIVGERGVEFIRTLKKLSGTNPPDLLVLPARGKFFFVEVKRDRENIRTNQGSAFTKIETELGCRIMIASLKRVKEIEDSSMPEECKKAYENCLHLIKRRNIHLRRGKVLEVVEDEQEEAPEVAAEFYPTSLNGSSATESTEAASPAETTPGSAPSNSPSPPLANGSKVSGGNGFAKPHASGTLSSHAPNNGNGSSGFNQLRNEFLTAARRVATTKKQAIGEVVDWASGGTFKYGDVGRRTEADVPKLRAATELMAPSLASAPR